MRLQKSIKIDNKEYTAKELTVKEILDLLSGSVGGSNSQKSEETQQEKQLVQILGDFFGETGQLRQFMDIALPNTKITDLIELAPSEIKEIWDIVKEVNTHFFEVAQKMEIPQTLLGMAKELLTDFSQHAVVLSKRAMEEEFSNTDIPFLKQQSTPTSEKS